MNISIPAIPVPAGLLPDRSAVDIYRALLSAALKAGAAPEAVEIAGIERKTIFLGPVLGAKLTAAAGTYKMSVQETFAGLVRAGLRIVETTRQRAVSVAHAIEVPFPDPRPGQDRFYKAIMASLETGRICMAEASTGIGKSRALVAAALVTARAGKLPVVIAAPTLAILGDSLWREYETIKKTMGESIKVRFFPGASEFVDHEKLTEWLAESRKFGQPVDAAVATWAAAGGPVMHETPLIRALASTGQPLRWLMHDLRTLATELDPTAFAYRSENAEIQEMLAAIRADAADADVVFCTQAMLARAHQSGWQWFPKPAALIIDEAHQFEQIVAGAYSNRVSLYSLRSALNAHRLEHHLGNKTISAKAADEVSNLIGFLKNWDGGTTLVVDHNNAQYDDWRQQMAGLGKLLSSRSLAEVRGIQEARDTIRTALSAQAGAPHQRTYIEYSPDRRFPSVMAGTASVGGILGALWKTMEGGAVLASATLYTPDEFGNPKCDYTASLLAVPASRLDTPTPIIADWITAIPVLHTPSTSKLPLLSRPRRDERTEQAETDWLTHVGAEVTAIAGKAKGGTLVLCASYAQVAAIEAALLAHSLPPFRIVAQSGDRKFTLVQKDFRDRHAQGMRPILLATGAAWTGIDLTDKSLSAADDTLLTDLVIACLPIGLNKTSSMQSRIEKTHTYPIIREALMTLRQGLGRIVRSSEARNKHIWFLDARLWTPWPGMETLQKAAKYLLSQYKQKAPGCAGKLPQRNA